MRRRRAAAALAAGLAGLVRPVPAQTVVAFPFYRAEQALQALFSHHFPARMAHFEQEATELAAIAVRHCGGLTAQGALARAWDRTRLAWMTASVPALGPLLSRRSQREIDFWPLRPALAERALAGRPLTLSDMAGVGGPAKGLPAIEWLLNTPPAPTHCPHLALVAEGIAAEATALRWGFEALAEKDWGADETVARATFALWVNQWLGALENLRWQQIEQPLQRARSSGRPAVFARRRIEDNRADWQAQWQVLHAQALLLPSQRAEPPAPGQALLSLEALLFGKGQLALAGRWARAVDAVGERMAALPERPREDQMLALAAAMKAVTALYQRELAAAVDVQLGFSSSDGD